MKTDFMDKRKYAKPQLQEINVTPVVLEDYSRKPGKWSRKYDGTDLGGEEWDEEEEKADSFVDDPIWK